MKRVAFNDKDKIVSALECNLNFTVHKDCETCAYQCSEAYFMSIQADLVADALALIKQQAKALEEWGKYAPFLAAHGFFR